MNFKFSHYYRNCWEPNGELRVFVGVETPTGAPTQKAEQTPFEKLKEAEETAKAEFDALDGKITTGLSEWSSIAKTKPKVTLPDEAKIDALKNAIIEKGKQALTTEQRKTITKAITSINEWLVATDTSTLFNRRNEVAHSKTADILKTIRAGFLGNKTAYDKTSNACAWEEALTKYREAKEEKEKYAKQQFDAYQRSIGEFIQNGRTMESLQKNGNFQTLAGSYETAINTTEFALLREDAENAESMQIKKEYRELFFSILYMETNNFKTSFPLGDEFGNNANNNIKAYPSLYQDYIQHEGGTNLFERARRLKNDAVQRNKNKPVIPNQSKYEKQLKIKLPTLDKISMSPSKMDKRIKTISDFIRGLRNQKKSFTEDLKTNFGQAKNSAEKWLELANAQKRFLIIHSKIKQLNSGFTLANLEANTKRQLVMQLALRKFKKAIQIVDGAFGNVSKGYNPAVRRLLIALVYKNGVTALKTRDGYPDFQNRSQDYSSFLRQVLNSGEFNTQEEGQFLDETQWNALSIGIKIASNVAAQKRELKELTEQSDVKGKESEAKDAADYLKKKEEIARMPKKAIETVINADETTKKNVEAYLAARSALLEDIDAEALAKASLEDINTYLTAKQEYEKIDKTLRAFLEDTKQETYNKLNEKYKDAITLKLDADSPTFEVKDDAEEIKSAKEAYEKMKTAKEKVKAVSTALDDDDKKTQITAYLTANDALDETTKKNVEAYLTARSALLEDIDAEALAKASLEDINGYLTAKQEYEKIDKTLRAFLEDTKQETYNKLNEKYKDAITLKLDADPPTFEVKDDAEEIKSAKEAYEKMKTAKEKVKAVSTALDDDDKKTQITAYLTANDALDETTKNNVKAYLTARSELLEGIDAEALAEVSLEDINGYLTAKQEYEKIDENLRTFLEETTQTNYDALEQKYKDAITLKLDANPPTFATIKDQKETATIDNALLTWADFKGAEQKIPEAVRTALDDDGKKTQITAYLNASKTLTEPVRKALDANKDIKWKDIETYLTAKTKIATLESNLGNIKDEPDILKALARVHELTKEIEETKSDYGKITAYLTKPEEANNKTAIAELAKKPENQPASRYAQGIEFHYNTLELHNRGPEKTLERLMGIQLYAVYEGYLQYVKENPDMTFNNWMGLFQSHDKKDRKKLIDMLKVIIPDDIRGGKERFIFILNNMENEDLLSAINRPDIEINDPKLGALGILGTIKGYIKIQSKIDTTKTAERHEYKKRLKGRGLSEKLMDQLGEVKDMLLYGEWNEKIAAGVIFVLLYKAGRKAFGSNPGPIGNLFKIGLGILAIDVVKKRTTGTSLLESLKAHDIDTAFEGTHESALVKYSKEIMAEGKIKISEEQQHETLKQIKNVPFNTLMEWYHFVKLSPGQNIKPERGTTDPFKKLRPRINTNAIFALNKKSSQDPDLVGRTAVFKTLKGLFSYVGNKDGRNADYGMKALEARWITPLKTGDFTPKPPTTWIPTAVLEKYKNNPEGLTWETVMKNEISTQDVQKTVGDNIWDRGYKAVEDVGRAAMERATVEYYAPTKAKAQEYFATARYEWAPEVKQWVSNIIDLGATKVSFAKDRITVWYGANRLEIRRFIGAHWELAKTGFMIPVELIIAADQMLIPWTNGKLQGLRQIIKQKYGNEEIAIPLVDKDIDELKMTDEGGTEQLILFNNPYYKSYFGDLYAGKFGEAWDSSDKIFIDKKGLDEGTSISEQMRNIVKPANVAYFVVETNGKNVPQNITDPGIRANYMKTLAESEARDKIRKYLKQQKIDVNNYNDKYFDKYLYAITSIGKISKTDPKNPQKIYTFFRLPLQTSIEYKMKEEEKWADYYDPRRLKNRPPFFVDSSQSLTENLGHMLTGELAALNSIQQTALLAASQAIRYSYWVIGKPTSALASWEIPETKEQQYQVTDASGALVTKTKRVKTGEVMRPLSVLEGLDLSEESRRWIDMNMYSGGKSPSNILVAPLSATFSGGKYEYEENGKIKTKEIKRLQAAVNRYRFRRSQLEGKFVNPQGHQQEELRLILQLDKNNEYLKRKDDGTYSGQLATETVKEAAQKLNDFIDNLPTSTKGD